MKMDLEQMYCQSCNANTFCASLRASACKQAIHFAYTGFIFGFLWGKKDYSVYLAIELLLSVTNHKIKV
jgi:hypothetical protein